MNFRKGDWVAQKEVARPNFGKVVDIFEDSHGVCLNVCMYDLKGNKVGRHSEALGGPTSFEPAVPAGSYAKIEEPQFPIERLGLYGNWDSCLKFVDERC